MLRRRQCDQKINKNFAQLFGQSDQKYQNIYIKASFESPKHLHQITIETLKYLKQICIEIACLSENWLAKK